MLPEDPPVELVDTLTAHRQMLAGANETHPEVDLHRALEVHAGLGAILTRWSEYSVGEQREIVKAIEYLVNGDDERPDLTDPDGFADDLRELHRLQAYLGYV